MVYLIYKVTNKLNNKIYIGKHKTKNKDDGYMGSGILIINAIKKHGKENFIKEILFECENESSMNILEKSIVNDEFIIRDDTYNIKLGGDGGWNYVNENGKNGCMYYVNKFLEDSKFRESMKLKISLGVKRSQSILGNPFKGRTHSNETKEKIRLKMKINQRGEKNSQYGTCWIRSDSQFKNKKVKISNLDSFLKNGWERGRKSYGIIT